MDILSWLRLFIFLRCQINPVLKLYCIIIIIIVSYIDIIVVFLSFAIIKLNHIFRCVPDLDIITQEYFFESRGLSNSFVIFSLKLI